MFHNSVGETHLVRSRLIFKPPEQESYASIVLNVLLFTRFLKSFAKVHLRCQVTTNKSVLKVYLCHANT